MPRWFRRPRFNYRPRSRRRWGITVPVGESRIPPEGTSRVIQDLAVVVIHAADALEGGIQDPPGLQIDDPSSPGPASSWGSGVIALDPLGDEITGETEHSRNPGGPDAGGQVTTRKRRRGGSGRQPNKNTLTLAPGGGGSYRCFQGQLTITITKPPPDIYGFNGTSTFFVGTICAFYNPPVILGPTTALTVRRSTTDADSPAGTFLPDHIRHWLKNHVGSDSFGTVTGDLVGLPSATLCTGHACSGAPPATVPGTGVGSVITAG